MRSPLSDLDGKAFDVAVIGGGVVGASSAQHLAARGFSTLLVDKGDFASGTTSRSSRLLYCGLAYLSPDYPLWRSVARPADVYQRIRMARLAMRCRAELATTMPERLSRHTFFFPIFEDSEFPGWKVDLGYRALGLLGPSDVPLNYRRLPAVRAAEQFGLVRLLDGRRLRSVAVFEEYQYQWAERICVDTVLDARACGATVRNYTRVTAFERLPGDRFALSLEDTARAGQRARVEAGRLVNAAGPWADRVLAKADGPKPTRHHLVGIKGVNLLVKLPDDCRGQGMETISSIGQPFYCMPWGDYHFLGPTETIFEDDADNVRVLPSEVDFILGEANRVFPGLSLTEADVVYSWCGMRPRTTSQESSGVKALTLHDMAPEGMPGAVTVTGCPIMIHRHAGRAVAAHVAAAAAPSGPPTTLSYAAKLHPDEAGDPLSPQVLRRIAAEEQVETLVDLLFRRVPVGWGPDMGLGRARQAARAVADVLGWDEARVDAEVSAYEAFVAEHFRPAALKGRADADPAPRKAVGR